AALNQILQECCDVADRKGLSELKRMLEQFLSEAKASGKRSSRASKLEPPSKKSKLAAMTPLPASGSADKKPAVTTKRKEPKFLDRRGGLEAQGAGKRIRFRAGEMDPIGHRDARPGGQVLSSTLVVSSRPVHLPIAIYRRRGPRNCPLPGRRGKAGKWAELAKAVSEQRRSTPSTNANSSPGKSNAETTAEMAVGVGGKKPEPISSQANDLSLGRGKEKTLYSAAPKLEPPSNNGTHSARSRKETAGLSDEAKTYLTKWLFDQKAYPYPNRQKKVELCNVLGISDLNQLDSWLCRARKKLMYQTSQSQVPKGVTKGVRDCPTGVRPKIPGGDKPADDAEEEAAVAEKTKLAAITPHPASGSAKKKPASTKKKEPNFWTEEEDSRLKELVSGFGSGPVKWTQLAAEMPGREAKSCQARWSCSVDPSISRSPFTAEEIRVIVRFQADEEKAGKWAELAKVLPGRTAKQVRSRWNSLNSNLKAASEQRQSIPSANTISSPGKSKAETTAEMAMGVGGEIPEPLSRPTLEEEGPEQSSRQPRLKSTGEGLAGNATRSSRRYDSGLSDPDMLDGEEGSSDCEDDDLDLYPDDAKRPTKKRRLEDSDDSDFKPHLPDGDDCGSDDDDDDDPSDLKIPYSVRVERARRGSTKYGTASNNYYTSMFEEDTPRGEILTKVLEKYTKERETVGCVKRSRLLEFLNEAQAEDPGRYGSFDMDPEWLARKLGKEHKKRTRRLTRDPKATVPRVEGGEKTALDLQEGGREASALALGPVEANAIQPLPALVPEVGGGDLGPLGLLPVHLALPVHPVAQGGCPLGLMLHPEESRDVERAMGGKVVEKIVEVILPGLRATRVKGIIVA
ncbi:hypothetical protein THAOC_33045, partial [Thalassiosira oceanica]